MEVSQAVSLAVVTTNCEKSAEAIVFEILQRRAEQFKTSNEMYVSTHSLTGGTEHGVPMKETATHRVIE